MSSICAECDSQVLDLKSHLKIHKDSKVECEVCGKVLTNRKAREVIEVDELEKGNISATVGNQAKL